MALAVKANKSEELHNALQQTNAETAQRPQVTILMETITETAEWRLVETKTMQKFNFL